MADVIGGPEPERGEASGPNAIFLKSAHPQKPSAAFAGGSINGFDSRAGLAAARTSSGWPGGDRLMGCDGSVT